LFGVGHRHLSLIPTGTGEATWKSSEGKPGISPVILAFVTVFQFMEKLPDRQAAEAVRIRLDWKYALRLPLTYAGFDYCHFA
jgi:transposase